VIHIAGKILGEMGITPADTKDNSGCNRFQRYNLNYVTAPQTHRVLSSAHSLPNQIVSPPFYILLCSIMKAEGVKHTYIFIPYIS